MPARFGGFFTQLAILWTRSAPRPSHRDTMRASAIALAAAVARAADVSMSWTENQDHGDVALDGTEDAVKIEWSAERSVVQFWDKTAYDARVPRVPDASPTPLTAPRVAGATSRRRVSSSRRRPTGRRRSWRRASARTAARATGARRRTTAPSRASRSSRTRASGSTTAARSTSASTSTPAGTATRRRATVTMRIPRACTSATTKARTRAARARTRPTQRPVAVTIFESF